MLRQTSWLPQAQALPLGQKERTSHDCGPGDVLLVQHTDKGWSGWCYRCADKGWVPKPLPSLHERLAIQSAQEAAEAAMERDPTPPQPPTYNIAEWPLEARVWLYKAALTNEDIERLGYYWHAPSKRVVLPVIQNGQVVYWQARRIYDGHPAKYINLRVPRGSVVPCYGSGNSIVLTEDILSSVRCGMSAESWSLMGTQLCPPVLAKLMKDGRPVLIWLDPDPGGWRAIPAIRRSLDLAGIKYHVINSEKDPKYYSRAEIAQIIKEAEQCLST